MLQDLDRLAAHLHQMGAGSKEPNAVIVEEDEDEEEDEANHQDGTLPASDPARPLYDLNLKYAVGCLLGRVTPNEFVYDVVFLPPELVFAPHFL